MPGERQGRAAGGGFRAGKPEVAGDCGAAREESAEGRREAGGGWVGLGSFSCSEGGMEKTVGLERE